ncbi:MAG: protein kinase [Candidatus Schekmanbacteria bacterium]|nr:protein kinase [Candidatus Schekmanbacteria bacterium]
MNALPQCIGPYLIVEVLGQGGMGIVYRACHQQSGREVALKTLIAERRAPLSAVRREIAALAALRHPGVVRILEHGVCEGQPWYAMELVNGVDLLSYCMKRQLGQTAGNSFGTPTKIDATAAGAETGAAPHDGSRHADIAEVGGDRMPRNVISPAGLEAVLGTMHAVATALAYLHGEGVVHRDLKPGNVLVGQDSLPVIVDFGLAVPFAGEANREALWVSDTIGGTASYMAPEQIRGELIDARADMYAAGCMMFQLLTGRLPFRKETMGETLLAHLNRPPLPPSCFAVGVPREVDHLVLALLEKDPRSRLAYAQDLARKLEDLAVPTHRWSNPPPPRLYLNRAGFWGRDEIVNQLIDHLRAAHSGRGGMILISGDGGSGKTRLAMELSLRAVRARMLVIEASFAVSEGRPAVGITSLLQRLADHSRRLDPAEARVAWGEHLDVLAAYEPALGWLRGDEATPQLAELPPDAAQLRLFSALTHVLLAIAEEACVLLLLDDLHLADELTGSFLLHLQRSEVLQDKALAVLATYCEDEETPLLRELRASQSVRHFALEHLSPDAVGAIVQEMLGMGERPRRFAAALARHAEGNPFFVVEYLRAAMTEGTLSRDRSGHWFLDVPEPASGAEDTEFKIPALPRSLRELAERRLDRVSAASRALLEIAAVLGLSFETALLRELSEQNDEEYYAALCDLRRNNILEDGPPDATAFCNARLQEVAYGALLPPCLVHLHRRAAQLLEGRMAARPDVAGAEPARAAEIAVHWERCGEAPRAKSWYLAAGRGFLKRYVIKEAEAALRAYLALECDPSAEAIGVRQTLAREVLYPRGDTAAAAAELSQALRDATAIDDARLRAASLLELGRLAFGTANPAAARANLTTAAELYAGCKDRAGEGKALRLMGQIHVSQEAAENAYALFKKALLLLRGAGDRREEALTVNCLAGIQSIRGNVKKAFRLHERALALLRQSGDQRGEAVAMNDLAVTLHEQGETRRAGELYDRAHKRFLEVGDRRAAARVAINLALILTQENEHEHGQRLFEEALTVNRAVGDMRLCAICLGNLAMLAKRRAQTATARDLFTRASTILERLGDKQRLCDNLRELAALERLSGNDAKLPSTIARRCVDLAREIGDRIDLILSLCELGHCRLALGESAATIVGSVEKIATTSSFSGIGYVGKAMAELRQAEAARAAGAPLLRGTLRELIPSALLERIEEEHGEQAAPCTDPS